eukprot:Seg258.3 transcript_id=Seg258.3/GoldUCD/mRNA.D3Y31 product="Membrane magnesium transporter 1-B" protein_id=Seg258.3/GoldUCD/D3Y31
MSLFSKSLVSFGILSLIHAGYSAVQFKTYLKLTEEEFVTLPVDIIVQVMFSLLISIFGIVRVAGELKDIHSAAELAHRSWETFGNRPSFYSFNHRGRIMFSDLLQD